MDSWICGWGRRVACRAFLALLGAPSRIKQLPAGPVMARFEDGEHPFIREVARRGAENGERQFLVVGFQFLVNGGTAVFGSQFLVFSERRNGSF